LERIAADNSTAVQLPDRLSVYLSAYLMLETERPDDLSFIPWSKYVMYGQYYGLDRDQIDWLIEIGFFVDNSILAERRKQNGDTPGAGKSAKQVGRHRA
jgi:hypothetical protein